MRPATNLAEAFAQACALDAPLAQQLESYENHLSQFNPAFHAGYSALIARLKAARAGAAAPKVGGRMPAFLLPDQSGSLVSLDGLLAKGPVVLSFSRGHWCPFCKLELRALSQWRQRLEAQGARLIGIMPDHPSHSVKTRELGVDFPILFDLDNGYGLELGLAIWVDDAVARLMLQRGFTIDEFQGNSAWLLPIPATFVIGVDGRVKARFVDPDFRKRMAMVDILKALRPVRSKRQPL